MTHTQRALCALGLAGLTLAPVQLTAQLAPAAPTAAPRLDVGLVRPIFDEDDFGALSAVLRARGLVPVHDQVAVFAEAGVARATYESEGSTTISNVTLGATLGREGGSRWGSLAVTVPTIDELGFDDFATAMGLFADPENMHLFIPDALALDGSVTGQRVLASGNAVGFRLGGQILDSTEDDVDAEWSAKYALFGKASSGQALLGLELSGQLILSEDGDLGERSWHMVTGSFALPKARSAPELFVRFPVDEDLGDVLKVIVGLRVSF